MALEKRYKYIAFFDLDHTILSVNSANSLVRESLTRGMMSKRQYRHALFLSILYKLNWKDATMIIYRMLRWLSGLSKSRVESMCQDVFNHTLKDLIRPEIFMELERHKQKGGANVLLSSATTFVCMPVANHLKLDDMICSHIEEVNGILTGKPIGKLVFGKEKKNQLISYCEKHNYKAEDAYYYGDSISDIHVLEAVGHPVCVDPDKKLKKKAVRRGWKIIV